MGCPISQVVCHPFLEQGIGKVFSVIFTFQCFLGVALEIKFNFTTQMILLSYFRIAGFFHNHGTNMTKPRFTRHATDVAQFSVSLSKWRGPCVQTCLPDLGQCLPDETTVWRKLYHICSSKWTPLKPHEKRCLVHIKHTGLQIQQIFLHTKSSGIAGFTAQVFGTWQRGLQLLCQFMAAEANVAVDLNMKICHLLHNNFSLLSA